MGKYDYVDLETTDPFINQQSLDRFLHVNLEDSS